MKGSEDNEEKLTSLSLTFGVNIALLRVATHNECGCSFCQVELQVLYLNPSKRQGICPPKKKQEQIVKV